MRSNRLRKYRLLFLAVAIIAGDGCAGQGCSCMAPLPNGFPAAKRQANGAQARLSDKGIQFLEQNAPTLVQALVGGPLNFAIPSSCSGNPQICCGVPAGACEINIDVNPQAGDTPRLDLSPKPASLLGVLLRARVKTHRTDNNSAKLPFKYDTGLFTVDCDLTLNTTSSGDPSLELTADLSFDQDGAAGTTRVSVQNVNLNNLDNGDISISGGLTCAIADLLKGIFKDQIIGGFKDQIAGTIEQQLCKKCTTDGDCAPFATCDTNAGQCMVNGANPARCLQELGTSGRLAGATMLSGISPGNTGSLDIYLVAGGFAKANDNGMSLGLLSGSEPSAAHDACVPVVPEPSPGAIPESTTIEGNTRPDGQPFMVGIGISKAFLDHAGWAAYDSGFLCLNVGTRSVALLNTETFNILIPSVTDLTHGQNSPLILSLRPQQPPTFTLGAGTFTPAGEIDQPLMIVNFPQLQIDFYTLIDERYSRIFTLQTDLALPIALDTDANGQIVPVIGDLGNAFQNIVVTNSELLAEDTSDIATKFPAVLSVAAPFLSDALKPIALPAVIGLNIQVPKGGFTSVDGNSELAIFANLAPAMPKPTPRVETTAEIVNVKTPPTEVFGRKGELRREDRPVVELALGGAREDGVKVPLEWQVRLDDGLWGPYVSTPERALAAEQFWLQGRHKLEVRAREVGVPASADDTPVELEAIIDSIAPAVTLTQDETGEHVTIAATDLVTPAGAFGVSWRFGTEGAWQSATGLPLTVPVGELDPSTIEVLVRDEAGNVGAANGQLAGFHGRVPATSSGCGCHVGGKSGGGSSRGALVLVGLCALAGAAARRRRLVPFAVAALLAVALVALPACGGGSIGGDADAGMTGPKAAQPGAMGRYVDIAASNGRVVVAGYEDAFGDLVMSDVSPTGEVTMKPVDGVPAGPVQLDPNGYRGGIKAPGDDVGAFTSIAIVGGKVIAAYQDVAAGALLFGTEGATWTRQTVDDPAGMYVTGLYNSLTVDQNGVPAIAYMASRVPDGSNGFKAQLKWAQASSATPASSADWTISVIYEAPIPCAGLCGDPAANACVAATNQCAVIEATCSTACGSTQACVGGTCVDTLADPGPTVDLPEGPGLFASAGRLPDDKPVVAFYDRTQGDLMLASFDGATWTTIPLDSQMTTDTGQWSSLAVSADGTVHVAYEDAVDDSLHYITWTGGTVGMPELVDDGIRPDRPHPVGGGAAMVIDASGGVDVVYQDSATNDLLVAKRDPGTGMWSHSDLLAGTVGYGFYNSAANDGGKTWVATFGYTREGKPLGQVYVTPMP